MVGETVINLSTVAATFFLATRFDSIGGWGVNDLYFMLGFVLVARGVANVFSGRNVLMISRKIARGQLDHVLTQPLPLWKALAAEGFSPFDLAVTLALGIGVLIATVPNSSASPSVYWYVILALNLAASVIVVVSYQYMWGSLAFYAPRGAEEVNTTSFSVTNSLSGYPLDATPLPVKGILLSIIPVGFIGWLPSRSLLYEPVGFGPWLTPVFSIILALLTVFVFRKGLKRYAHIGSGRYSDWGHRR